MDGDDEQQVASFILLQQGLPGIGSRFIALEQDQADWYGRCCVAGLSENLKPLIDFVGFKTAEVTKRWK